MFFFSTSTQEKMFIASDDQNISSLGLVINKCMENKKDFYPAFFSSLLYNFIGLLWNHKILISILLLKMQNGSELSISSVLESVFLGIEKNFGIREYLIAALLLSQYLLKPLDKFRKKKVKSFMKKVKIDLKINVLQEIERKSLEKDFRPSEDWSLLQMTRYYFNLQMKSIFFLYSSFFVNSFAFLAVGLFFAPIYTLIFLLTIFLFSFIIFYFFKRAIEPNFQIYSIWEKINIHRNFDFPIILDENVKQQEDYTIGRFKTESWRTVLQIIKYCCIPALAFLLTDKLNNISFLFILGSFIFDEDFQKFFETFYDGNISIPDRIVNKEKYETRQKIKNFILSKYNLEFKSGDRVRINGFGISTFLNDISNGKKIIGGKENNVYIPIVTTNYKVSCPLEDFFMIAKPNIDEQEIFLKLEKVRILWKMISRNENFMKTPIGLKSIYTKKEKILIEIARSMLFNDIFVSEDFFDELDNEDRDFILKQINDHFKIVIIATNHESNFFNKQIKLEKK